MTVIDVHAHAWPDSIAARALEGSIPGLRRFGDGRVASLLKSMDASGVDRAVCLAVANTPDRVDAANRFVASLDRSRFVGLGSVHAGLSPEDNVGSLERHVLPGAKIHAVFQNYRLDSPSLLATLEAMEGRFIALIHVGVGIGNAGERCTPEMVRRIVERFPRLDVVACHFGGYHVLDEAEESVIGLPVYVDTSWPPSMSELNPARVQAIIERHGADRVLFGSDWPMASPAKEIEVLRKLELPNEELGAILGGNAARLFAAYEKE
jgi:predicted TIM-barrel fold metal-dependent hydrolase